MLPEDKLKVIDDLMHKNQGVAMVGDLSRHPLAIALSRAAHTIIQQNLRAAFGAVALLISATLLGIASMGIAVLVLEGATVLVVLNALRLLRFVDTADLPMTQRKEGALRHEPQAAQRVC